MGLNNKKNVISKVLTLCIVANLMGSSTLMADATTLDTSATNDITTQVDVESNSTDTMLTEVPNQQNTIDVANTTCPLDTTLNVNTSETQSSIIKKLDFEYEIQTMIETYKDIKETEKNQNRLDTLDYISKVIDSKDYSIEEKRSLCSSTISQAVLDDVLSIKESINLKKDCEIALNKQSDAENLNLTIEKILNSSVSISSKKDFCLNSLELANLSETISNEEYQNKIAEVTTTLDELKRLEDKKIAEEKAIQQAKQKEAEELARQEAERQAVQQAINEKAQSATTDTSVDTSNLQTMPSTQESTSSSNVGFNGNLTYTDRDFLALVNVVQHEVGNCSTLSKQMVASVVINRALSGIFPASIYDVVSQNNQFTGMSAYINRTDYATQDTIYWCQSVIDGGIDYSNGALFYYAPQWCGYMSYFENMTLVAEHDGQRFFK